MHTVGKARDVLLNGELVVQNGTVIKTGAGKFVFRGKSLRPNR